MSDKELEESVNDSDENLNDDTGEETWTPDETSKGEKPKKSNKSNWKDMSEAKKALEKKLAEAEEELEAWRSENPDIVKETLTKKESKWVDKSELALFIAVNPEARDHLDAIKEFAEEFNFKLDSEESLNKAWKRVKPTIAKESQTEKDFEIKSKWSTRKVDISKLSADEIYSWEYSDAQKREWRKINSDE